MNPKDYIKAHRGGIRKVIVIGVPAAAGVALGCRFGVIPYKQIAGTAVRIGRKVPVKAIGRAAKDGAVLLLDSKIAEDIYRGVRKELKGDTGQVIARKILEVKRLKGGKEDEQKQ